MIPQMRKFVSSRMNAAQREKVELPNKENILETLYYLRQMATGRLDRLFCNRFIAEMLQLLANAVFLYEEGYFECAFYSVRQAEEVGNNMIFLAENGKEELKKWEEKERFPSNSRVVQELQKAAVFYQEVHNAIPSFFEEQKSLIQKAHKIVHKQGFDTFYSRRASMESFDKDKETEFFLSVLNHTIALSIILYIVTDPLSLILADEELSQYVPFDPLTDPAPVDFIIKHFSADVIDKIKDVPTFSEFANYFRSKEKLIPEVADVRKCQYFDVNALDVIRGQEHLLSLDENIILAILSTGAAISSFYPDSSSLGYFTSIPSLQKDDSYSSSELESYQGVEEQFNIAYKNIYRSVFRGVDCNWLLEHNEKLSETEISKIQSIFRKEEIFNRKC